jgi:hypothetical protein
MSNIQGTSSNRPVSTYDVPCAGASPASNASTEGSQQPVAPNSVSECDTDSLSQDNFVLSRGAEFNAWSGDSLEERMAVMVLNNATDSRKQATEQRAAAEQRITSAEEDQIRQMRRNADLYRQQASVDLALSVASAAGDLAGSACGKDSGGAAASKAASKGLDAAQKYGDTLYDRKREQIGISKQDANNRADAAKRELGQINDSKKAADDLESRALNFMTTAAQLHADGERAAIFRG